MAAVGRGCPALEGPHTWPERGCCAFLQSLPRDASGVLPALSLRGKSEGWIFMRTRSWSRLAPVWAGGGGCLCPGSWAVEDLVSKEWKWGGSLQPTQAWPGSNPSAEACGDSRVLLGAAGPCLPGGICFPAASPHGAGGTWNHLGAPIPTSLRAQETERQFDLGCDLGGPGETGRVHQNTGPQLCPSPL